MVGKRMMLFLAAVVCAVGVVKGVQTLHGQADAATYNLAVPHDASIPKEALRLRIIANSDSPSDQALKREVRDAVVVEVGGMLKSAQSATAARTILVAHETQLNALAASVVHQHGYHYAVRTTIGSVPFPTKIYGNRVYPAGNYQALRIVLGAGQGANWWCVLYPPLCFVDIADGDAVPNTGGFPDLPPLETIQVKTANGHTQSVQVRSMALDYGEMLLKSLRSAGHH